MSHIKTPRDVGTTAPIIGTPTKEEHDAWVEEHGKPFTDNWFPWIGRVNTKHKIKEGE